MTRHSSRLGTRDRVLRSTLEAQRISLAQTARGMRRTVRDETIADAGTTVDLAEQSDADVRVDVELALLAFRSEMLRELDDALARLAGGTYERCCDCGDDISVERLRALPSTPRCLECEEMHEAAAQHERQVTARHLAKELGSLDP